MVNREEKYFSKLDSRRTFEPMTVMTFASKSMF